MYFIPSVASINPTNLTHDVLSSTPTPNPTSYTNNSSPVYTVHRSGLAPLALGPGRPDHLRAKGRARHCVALTLFGRATGQHRWPVARRVGPWPTRPGPQLTCDITCTDSTCDLRVYLAAQQGQKWMVLLSKQNKWEVTTMLN